MKLKNRIIGGVLIFFVGVGVGIAIDEKSFNLIYTVILPGVVTLLAVFLGAKYAFQLQADKKEEELLRENVAAGNRAIFAIIRKFNKLKNFDVQFLESFKGDPTAFLQMPPLLDLVKDDINLDIDSISFLLETKFKNLLGEISTGLGKYQSAIDAINARSRLHIAHVQPLLERAGIVEGGNYSMGDIEKALGQRLFVTIKQATNQVFEHTIESLNFIEEISNKLTKALKEVFPGKEIIALGKAEDVNTEHNNILKKDLGDAARPSAS